MTLENRLQFREALLEHRTEEEWKQNRFHHMEFYCSNFSLEGKELTGKDLIEAYAFRFPSDREYSEKGNLNRMLAECNIPQFLFTDPEILRGFLLSAKTPLQWSKYEPNIHNFGNFEFQYNGIKIKGQMLQNNAVVELENKENGTYYAYVDYLNNPDLQKKLWISRNSGFISKLFNIAELRIKDGLIEKENITREKLREILLTKMSEDEWNKWNGGANDFTKIWFDIKGYKKFTGRSLTKSRKSKGEKYFVKDIFDDAGIKVGSDPELLKKRIEDHFEKFYRVFDDANSIRELFLQIKSEDEWNKPQQYVPLRKEKVTLDEDRSIAIHTLCQLFSVYKYNLQQENVNSWLDLNKAQDRRLVESNKDILGELLSFAGLEYKFIPDAGEVNLHDPILLRKLLSHGVYRNREISIDKIKSMSATNFRNVVLINPEDKFELTGHSLMIYYSALNYVKEHPEVGLNEAANKLHKGKSNQKVMNEILERL